jgi:carboxyl-terminal processing protease
MKATWTFLCRMRRSIFLTVVWVWVACGDPALWAKDSSLPKSVRPAGSVARARAEVQTPRWPEVSRAMGELLEREHFLKRPMDAALSGRVLERFLEELDPLRLYFYRSDVEEFCGELGPRFAFELREGNGTALRRVLGRLAERVVLRQATVEELLGQAWNFEEPWQAEIHRDKSPWPSDAAAAWKLWREQIGTELLAEKLEGIPLEEALAHARKRQEQMVRVALGADEQERWELGLKALARAYDAHTEYLPQSELDDQESELRLSRVGIGVTVESDPAGLRVAGLLPGGPAQVDGRLRVNDRIVALADGNGKFQDLAGYSLSRAISLLRGRKGSLVRIEVVCPKSDPPGKRMVIALRRQEMRDAQGEAYGKLVEVDRGEQRFRGGWISVPGFYGDDQAEILKRRSSVARDVESLVKRMKAERVEGLVLDLRGNLGGLLDEAVELAGLFLGRVPIVLVKSVDGTVEQLEPTRVRRPLFEGPLVVLTDRQSASASELVAGALQDYRRAVVVGGEQTFGKGSVQLTLPLKEFLGRDASRWPVGGLTLSVAKYYRVSGQSTQLTGVRPDVRLPSTLDVPWEGEFALADPLAHDAIEPLTPPVEGKRVAEGWLEPLREASRRRVNQNREFRAIGGERDRLREEWEQNRVSLKESERREQAEQLHRRYTEREERMGELELKGQFQRLRLADVRLRALPKVAADPLRSQDPESLAVEAECFRVLEDLASRALGH